METLVSKKLGQLVLILFVVQNILFAFTFFCASIAINIWQKNYAENMASIVRRDLVIGDYRKVIINLGLQVEKSFEYIAYIDSKNEVVFSLPSNISPKNMEILTEDKPIYYSYYYFNIFPDYMPSENSGKIVFIANRARNLGFAVVMWFLLAAVLVGFFFIARKILLKSHKHELELQKEATIGKFISNICHDLAHFLHPFEQIASNIEKNPPAISKKLIISSLNKVYGLIDSLRNNEVDNLLNKNAQNWEVKSTFQIVEYKLSEHNISLNYVGAEEFYIYVDFKKLERAILNIIINAIEAAKTYCEVRIKQVECDLQIEVCDDGEGISKEIVNKIFERRFSSNKENGSGLGLNYAKRIIETHGGLIEYKRINETTIFSIFLPNVVYNIPQNGANTLKTLKSLKPVFENSSDKSILLLLESIDLSQELSPILDIFSNVLIVNPLLDKFSVDTEKCLAIFTDNNDVVARYSATNIPIFILQENCTLELLKNKIYNITHKT